MDSFPSEGPTISLWTICALAGSFPAFNTLAKSFASLMSNCPEMDVLPVVIASLTRGAV